MGNQPWSVGHGAKIHAHVLAAWRWERFVQSSLRIRDKLVLGVAMERLGQANDGSAHDCALLDQTGYLVAHDEGLGSPASAGQALDCAADYFFSPSWSNAASISMPRPCSTDRAPGVHE